MTSISRRRIALSDAHGHLDSLRTALRRADLVDEHDAWRADDARVWILGDYLDRGEQGLEVVELVRALEAQAGAAGGHVLPLLGNHELQFLAALHFGESATTADGMTSWLAGWRRYGGVDRELAQVTEAQVAWMTGLPLLAVDGTDLLMHSDTAGYLEFGSSVEEINATGHAILTGRSAGDWAHLHEVMARRGELLESGPRDLLMERLGVHRIVHGHNTLRGGFGLDDQTASAPWSYGDGCVLAIDGGVFEGGDVLLAEL